MKIVISSGYFNPLHIGHINLLKDAKQIGDFLVVIVNNDKQVKIKGSVAFMPQQERIEIIKSLKYVDEVFLAVDKDHSVCKSLERLAEKYKGNKLIFAKGGDRNSQNIPELSICQKLDIKIIDSVGGGKIQSSSWLLKNTAKTV